MKFQFVAPRESYDDFPKVTCLGCNSGVCKNPNFLISYIRKYSDTTAEIWTPDLELILLKWVLSLDSETF